MKYLKNLKMKNKIIFMLVVWSMITITLFASVISIKTYNNAFENEKENIGNVSFANSLAFSKYFNMKLKPLYIIEQTSDLTKIETDIVLQKKLNEIRKSENYLNFAYFNTEGDAVVFSDEVIKLSLKGREYTKCIDGNPRIVGPYIDQVSKESCITASVPIKNSSGKIIGGFAIDFKTSDMSNFLTNVSVGETGYAFAVDKDLKLIGHKDHKILEDMNNGKKAENSLNEQKVRELLASINEKESSNSEIIEKADGTDFFVHASIIPNIDGANWYFVSVLPVDEIKAVAINMIKSIGIVAILILILAPIIGLGVGKLLSREMINAEAIINKLSELDLKTREDIEKLYLKNENRKDEIGSFFKGLKNIKLNLKGLVEEIKGSTEDTSKFSLDFKNELSRGIDTINEISQAVNNIAEGASSQAEETTEANLKIEEVSNLFKKVTEIVDKLNENTDLIANKKEEGKDLLKTLNELSLRSREEAGTVGGIIIDTNESSKNIAEASLKIKEIADQTNLLALNAAIEAARAGEAGRGFAVVAEEIRKLADSSTKFAGEISDVIDELYNKSTLAKTRMVEVGEITKNQDDALNDVLLKFNEIDEAVNITEESMQELISISTTATGKNNEMLEVIQNLSAIAEENAATTEEASASAMSAVEVLGGLNEKAGELEEMVRGLRGEVDKFKL